MMAHIECWLGSFVVFFRGSGTVRNGTLYFFVIFQGGGPGPLSPPSPPPLDPRMSISLCLDQARRLARLCKGYQQTTQAS